MPFLAPKASSSRMMLVRQSTTVPNTSNTSAFTCETSPISEPPLSCLRPVPQRVVGQHDGHHGLAHRHGTDADARVVPALGHDLGLVAEAVDGFAGSENRGRGLDRKAADDRLTRRDAAENAAGVVRREYRSAVGADAHFIGVLLTGQLGRSHARTDFH